MSFFNEAGFENAIIDLLKDLGYQYIHGPDLDRDYSVPYYESELEDSISRLNPSLSKEAIENAKNAEVIITEDTSNEQEENENWFSNIKEGVSNIGNKASEILEKGKQVLSNFIDTAAILIITTCVIPILVLILMIWIVKIFIGIEIPTSNFKFKEKKLKKEKIEDNIAEVKKSEKSKEE